MQAPVSRLAAASAVQAPIQQATVVLSAMQAEAAVEAAVQEAVMIDSATAAQAMAADQEEMRMMAQKMRVTRTKRKRRTR